MVALLVAIAVVFVSSLFFQSSLTFTFTCHPPSPPTHIRTYTNLLHILITSLYYQTVVVNAVMALLC